MKRIIYLCLVLIGILCMSVYDFTGNYKIQFKIEDLNESNHISVPTQQLSSGSYIELVWNTGDTGSTIRIDTPGVYIVSAKDVWSIKKSSSDGHIVYDTIIQKSIFVHGYPDTVQVKTFNFDVDYFGESERTVRTFRMIQNNEIVDRSFVDTLYYNYSDSTVTYTETHAICKGFWSGMLDTIVIRKQSLPIMVNAKIMVRDNKILTGKKWRVLQ